jgi:hypothetical protein
MLEVSRRKFLQQTSFVGLGVGLLGAAVGAPAFRAGLKAIAPGTRLDPAELPLVAHVRDLETGEMSIMRGGREVVLRAPALAAELARALG